MCILLKLNYAKCSVSDVFFSKVIEERPLGARPPGTGRVYSNDALHADGSVNSNLEYRDRFAKGQLLIAKLKIHALFKEFNVPAVHTRVTLSAFEICVCIA